MKAKIVISTKIQIISVIVIAFILVLYAITTGESGGYICLDGEKVRYASLCLDYETKYSTENTYAIDLNEQELLINNSAFLNKDLVIITNNISLVNDSLPRFFGSIKNYGDKKAYDIKVVVNFYNLEKNLVESSFTYLRKDLEPGAESEFSLFGTNKEFVNYSIEVVGYTKEIRENKSQEEFSNYESKRNILASLDRPIVQPSISETETGTWYEIIRFQGEGIKDTETFNIPSNEWKISWETKPRIDEYGEWDSNFVIYVYKENGEMEGLVANIIGYSKDSSIKRGAGKYYLSIISGQPYTIIIEAKY